MPFKITGVLHHVEMNVSDFALSKKFWSGLLSELGYQHYQEWPQGISYKLHETYPVFVQTEDRFLPDGYH